MALALLLLSLALQGPSPRNHPVPLPADYDMAACTDCHTAVTVGKSVHAAVAMGCATCHTVETKEETTRIGLTAPLGDLCATCHEAKTDAVNHGPYKSGQCLRCHDAHASGFPLLVRAESNALCLSCHQSRRTSEDPITLIGNQKVPAGEFAKFPKIYIDRTGKAGHPMLGHPVTGGPDPFREGQAYSCLSCHTAHTAPVTKLLREAWKGAEVCDQCHLARQEVKKP